MKESFQNLKLGYDTPFDPALQNQFETLEANIRAQYGLTSDQTAAVLHPPRGDDYLAALADAIDELMVSSESVLTR